MKICSDSASAIKRKQGSAEKVDDKIQSIENELQIKLESVQKKADRINLMEQEVKQLELTMDSERGKYILHLGRPLHANCSPAALYGTADLSSGWYQQIFPLHQSASLASLIRSINGDNPLSKLAIFGLQTSEVKNIGFYFFAEIIKMARPTVSN